MTLEVISKNKCTGREGNSLIKTQKNLYIYTWITIRGTYILAEGDSQQKTVNTYILISDRVMKNTELSNAKECVGWKCYFIPGKDLSEEVTFEIKFVRGRGNHMNIWWKSIAGMK